MAELFYRIKLLYDRFGAEPLKLETRKQVYATESEVKQRYEEIELKDIMKKLVEVMEFQWSYSKS